jgi:membrane protease YdiL (CAAX protease family)
MDLIPEEITKAIPRPPAVIKTPQAKSSSARRIFFGPYGLRAGWSLLIYLPTLAAIVLSVRTVESHIKGLQPHAAAATSTPAQSTSAADAPIRALPLIINDSVAFTIFFLTSGLMALIERRRVAVFGLGGQRPVSRFFFGAFWGFTSLSLLVGSLHALHLLSFDARLLHGFAVVRWGATLLFAFLILGLFEEYSFRGYLQFTLTRGLVGLGNSVSSRYGRLIAFGIASSVVSGLFLYVHTANSGEGKIGLASVFFASLTFLVALWRTGSLWWAIGFHMAWNWAQSFLYGVPDSGLTFQGQLFATHALGNPMLSGGTVGPEGSVLVIPTFAIVILVLCFTHPSPQPSLEILRPKTHKPDEVEPGIP